MPTLTLRSTVKAILTRELMALRRAVEAYPDDASLWRTLPGIANVGGTLVLHLVGNLQHFIGAVLGHNGYQRDREREFSRRNVGRAEMLKEIDAAIAAVDVGLDELSDDALGGIYPEKIASRDVATADLLVHLTAHLGYHLGQLDYHRRVVTGDGRTVGALAAAELPPPHRVS